MVDLHTKSAWLSQVNLLFHYLAFFKGKCMYHTQVLISIHIFSFKNEEENNSCKNNHALQEQNSFTLLFLVIEEGKEFLTYVEILNTIVNYSVMFQDTYFWQYFHFLELVLITEGENVSCWARGFFFFGKVIRVEGVIFKIFFQSQKEQQLKQTIKF